MNSNEQDHLRGHVIPTLENKYPCDHSMHYTEVMKDICLKTKKEMDEFCERFNINFCDTFPPRDVNLIYSAWAVVEGVNVLVDIWEQCGEVRNSLDFDWIYCNDQYYVNVDEVLFPKQDLGMDAFLSLWVIWFIESNMSEKIKVDYEGKAYFSCGGLTLIMESINRFESKFAWREKRGRLVS